jgi:hypothetical protein
LLWRQVRNLPGDSKRRENHLEGTAMRRRRPSTFRPQVEAFEDRTVPAPVATFREGIGATPLLLQPVVDQFRIDLGGGNVAGPNGSFGGLRREINWDGVPNANAAPNNLAADFFNTTSPRGVLFSTAGTGFRVSADALNPPILFGELNPTYPATFQTFSPERIFTPLGNNVMEVSFRVPGTSTPATVRGFGAVFTDVDITGSTKLEFFNSAGTLIFSRTVLPNPGSQGLSFLGASFASGAPIARVRITAGNAALGPIDNPPATDIVAMDDFLYAEPQAVPAPIVVTGPDGKDPENVRVLDAATQVQKFSFLPFDESEGNAGVRVAVGDVNADGTPDILMGEGPGGTPQVRVFDGKTGNPLSGPLGGFLAFRSGFHGGVFVAAGDVNADGCTDVIVGADAGGAPLVRVFSGSDGSQLLRFLAYPPRFGGGVRVAAADVNGDGRSEIVVAPGAGRPGNVKVFDSTGSLVLFIPALNPAFRGGIFVAAGDLNGDGKSEIVTGTGQGGFPVVRVFNSTTGALTNAFIAFSPGSRRGVHVGAGDINGDGKSDIWAGTGGRFALVRGFDGQTFAQLEEFFAYDPFSFEGGVFVAGSRNR